MWYLVNKNNEVITTADDDYKFMVEALLQDYPESKVLSYMPRKIVEPALVQPKTTGTTTI